MAGMDDQQLIPHFCPACGGEFESTAERAFCSRNCELDFMAEINRQPQLRQTLINGKVKIAVKS